MPIASKKHRLYKFILGAIDPITIIGVLFLIITLGVGTYVINDKEFDFNIFEKAGSCSNACLQSDFPELCGCTSRNISQAPAGSGGITKKQVEEEIEENQQSQNNNNPPAAPPTTPPSTGCDADGVTYQSGAIVVGGSSSSGFSRCENNAWVPCPTCTITQLTTVPAYLQEQYNQAVQNILTSQEIAEQTAPRPNNLPVKLSDNQQEQKNICLLDGGMWSNESMSCSYQTYQQLQEQVQVIQNQRARGEKRCSGSISETWNGNTWDQQYCSNGCVNGSCIATVQSSIEVSRDDEGTTRNLTQIYRDDNNNVITSTTNSLSFAQTVEKVDEGFIRNFTTILRDANTNDILNALTQSIHTKDLAQSIQPVTQNQQNNTTTHQFADCHRDGLTTDQSAECDRKFNQALNFPIIGRYLQAYTPQNVQYTGNEFLGYNLYDPTKEQFGSSVQLGSTLTAAGALLGAGGGIIGGSYSLITATTPLATLAAKTALTQAVSLGFAGMTTLQTGTAVDVCTINPGSPECYYNAGMAIVSWTNIASSANLARAIQAGRGIQTATTINTGVNLANIGVDIWDIDNSCGDGQFASTTNCAGAWLGTIFDVGQSVSDFGLIEAIAKNINFSNVAVNPLAEVNFQSSNQLQLGAPDANLPKGINSNDIIDVVQGPNGNFVVPNTSTTALAVAPHLDIAQADDVITATIDEIPATRPRSEQEIAGLLAAPEQPINVTKDFADIEMQKVPVEVRGEKLSIPQAEKKGFAGIIDEILNPPLGAINPNLARWMNSPIGKWWENKIVEPFEDNISTPIHEFLVESGIIPTFKASGANNSKIGITPAEMSNGQEIIRLNNGLINPLDPNPIVSANARDHVLKKTSLSSVITDPATNSEIESYKVLLNKIQTVIAESKLTPLEAINKVLLELKPLDYKKLSETVNSIITKKGSSPLTALEEALKNNKISSTSKQIILDRVNEAVKNGKITENDIVSFVANETQPPINIDEIAIALMNEDSISAKVLCMKRIDCLETPLLQEALLNDLDVKNHAVIIGMGGTRGSADLPFRHGAIIVKDQNGSYQLVGYDLTTRSIEDFEKIAKRAKWGDFFLERIANNNPILENIIAVEKVYNTIKPNFGDELINNSYHYPTQTTTKLTSGNVIIEKGTQLSPNDLDFLVKDGRVKKLTFGFIDDNGKMIIEEFTPDQLDSVLRSIVGKTDAITHLVLEGHNWDSLSQYGLGTKFDGSITINVEDYNFIRIAEFNATVDYQFNRWLGEVLNILKTDSSSPSGVWDGVKNWWERNGLNPQNWELPSFFGGGSPAGDPVAVNTKNESGEISFTQTRELEATNIFENQPVLLTNNGLAAKGQNTNNNVIVNPYEDDWLKNVSSTIAEENHGVSKSEFFDRAYQQIKKMYPRSATDNERVIRTSLQNSDQPNGHMVGDVVLCGSYPLCFEKSAVLHVAGAIEGHESEIVSAFPLTKEISGHTWIEYTDSDGEYWVFDPNENFNIKRENAYEYYKFYYSLDVDHAKRAQYVVPNPNYKFQPSKKVDGIKPVSDTPSPTGFWDGVKKRWDESLLNWNNWGGGGSPVIDPVAIDPLEIASQQIRLDYEATTKRFQENSPYNPKSAVPKPKTDLEKQFYLEVGKSEIDTKPLSFDEALKNKNYSTKPIIDEIMKAKTLEEIRDILNRNDIPIIENGSLPNNVNALAFFDTEIHVKPGILDQELHTIKPTIVHEVEHILIGDKVNVIFQKLQSENPDRFLDLIGIKNNLVFEDATYIAEARAALFELNNNPNLTALDRQKMQEIITNAMKQYNWVVFGDVLPNRNTLPLSLNTVAQNNLVEIVSDTPSPTKSLATRIGDWVNNIKPNQIKRQMGLVDEDFLPISYFKNELSTRELELIIELENDGIDVYILPDGKINRPSNFIGSKPEANNHILVLLISPEKAALH